MTIAHEVTGVALVALAIIAHAWSPRIVGRPAVLSAIGWIVNGLAILAIGSAWVRC
jgi:hypothetical protein